LDSFDILIVGGGAAGLATAAALAGQGRRIGLLEREPDFGRHSSGRNAAIARVLTGREEHTALALEGRRLLAEAGLLQRTGGLLLGAEAEAVDATAAEAARVGEAVEVREGAGWAELQAAAHLAIPGDGVIDIHGMLQHCTAKAREGGVALRTGCGVRGIQPESDGFRIATDAGEVHTKVLVNAAGAWARELGRRAGGLDLALKPLRRHLAWSDVAFLGDRPWAWYLDRPFYTRPESGGLLMCPCDESEVSPPAAGLQPEEDQAAVLALAETVREVAPAFADRPLTRLWSGLRTFSPDRRFTIGWDPVNPRLFWVAGLGGHGMTTGLAVGRLAARMIAEHESHALSPSRFA
jgi:glycine/D-amino acid oxidase-like deaminating enzyme